MTPDLEPAALEAFERLLTYGTQHASRQGEVAGTLFRFSDGEHFFLADIDATAIRSALAALSVPEAEPVAWQYRSPDSKHWVTELTEATARYNVEAGGEVRALYTTPQAVAPTEIAGQLSILDEIALALESRGYVHMANGKGIGDIVDSLTASEAEAAAALTSLSAERDRQHEDILTYRARISAYEAEAASLRRKLEEYRRALEPFAEKSKAFDDAAIAMGYALSDDLYKPRTEFTHGQLRAARRALSQERGSDAR